jgi:ERCC4-type nuclease
MINISSKIIFDSREPINEIKDIIMDISSYALFPNFSIEALEYGDYYLENNNNICLIERKAYSDYISSIGDDLKKRFIKMRQEANICCLILEGSPKQVDHHVYYGDYMLHQSIKFNSYNNFMFSLGLDGIIIIPTINLKHTMLSILSIYDYIGRIDKRTAPKGSSSLEMLSMFPGIGRKKAHQLKKNYKNMSIALDDWRTWISDKVLNEFNKEW